MSFVERHFAIAKRDTSLRIESVGGISSLLATGGMGVAFASGVLFLVGKPG